ncbi:MAG: CAAX prenyl protease-related protein, partial [Planctomycetes bacterium]|nr:CAAX prenyl protease-related protein [Planctomycetota bacterium]
GLSSPGKRDAVSRPPEATAEHSPLPYVLPFGLYLVLTVLAARFPDVYPQAYSGAVVIVAVASLWLLRGRGIIVPHWRVGQSVLVGLVGIVLWIGLSSLQLESAIASHLPHWLRPSARAGFNPFESMSGPSGIWFFLAVRLVGLAVLTPLVEELFWRGFLLRWIISPDWQDVPLGRLTLRSFVIVTLLFTAAHPEWLAAAVYCALLNAWIYWKKNLWDCIVAHAVSNLALAVYVLSTGAWWLW